MDALGTLERAVSVLGAAEKLSTDGNREIRIQAWVYEGEALIPYPYWENNMRSTFIPRSVNFKGNTVSIYFPGTAFFGGETFAGTLDEGVNIQSIQSREWHLENITRTQTGKEVSCAYGTYTFINKPYKLTYSCGPVSITLTNVAWSEAHERKVLEPIRKATADRTRGADAFNEGMRKFEEGDGTDQFGD